MSDISYHKTSSDNGSCNSGIDDCTCTNNIVFIILKGLFGFAFKFQAMRKDRNELLVVDEKLSLERLLT